MMSDLERVLKEAAPPPPQPDVEAILRRARTLRRRRTAGRLATIVLLLALPGAVFGGVLDGGAAELVETTGDPPSPQPAPVPTPDLAPTTERVTDPTGSHVAEQVTPQPTYRTLPIQPPTHTGTATGGADDGKALWITFVHEGDIWVQRGDGMERTRLTTDMTSTDPYWSPDGGQIVFASRRTGDWEVWTMDPDGSNQRQLTMVPTADLSGAWSPDGKRVAFYTERHGGSRLYVMDADGSRQRPVLPTTSDLITQLRPSWSPDGQRLVFNAGLVRHTDLQPGQSPRPRYIGIYVASLDGSGVHRIGTGLKPEWSPDGTRIAFQCPADDGRARICTMDPDGSNAEPITDGYREQHEPFWSPDGRRVFFRELDPDTATNRLASVSAEGADHRVLPTPGDEWWADAVMR